MSRSTFYRHYDGVDEMVKKKRRAIRVNHRKLLKKLNRQNLRGAWVQTLVFIYQNREFFLMEMKRQNVGLLIEIVCEIEKQFYRKWFKYGRVDVENLMCVYTHGVIGAILAWGEEELSLEKMEHCLKLIKWLTKTTEEGLLRASQNGNKMVE